MSTLSFPAVDALIAKIDVRLPELADEQAALENARALLVSGENGQNGRQATGTRPRATSARRGVPAPARRPRGRRSGRAKPGEVPAAILRLLADGVVRTPRQLSAELGYPAAKISSAITPLNKDGRIVHGPEGRGWTVPAPASA